MTSNDELHQFIRSLSGPEKRYFKQAALKNNGGEAPNYLKLFEVYARMEVFQEERLKSLPYVKYFSESKNHLFEKILEHCRSFEKKHLHSLRLKEMIADIRFLRKRKVLKKCHKYIKSAKNLARELDDLTSLLEILEEERLLLNNSPGKDYHQSLQDLNQQRAETTNQIQQLHQLIFLSDELYAILLKGARLKPEELEQLSDSLPIGLLNCNPNIFSGRALRIYHVAKGFLGWLNNDFQSTYLSYQQLNDWWETFQKLAEENQNQYLADLSNYMSTTFRKKNWTLMKSLLIKMKRTKPKAFYDQQIQFYAYSLFQMLYSLETADLEGAKTLSIGIRRGIKKFQIEGKRKLILSINLAQIHFVREEHDLCAEELEALTRGQIVSKEDVRCVAHLLQMANLYSANRLEELDALYRRTRNVFQKLRLDQDSFEYQTIQTINQLQSCTPKEATELLNSFRAYLQQKLNNPREKETRGLDTIYYWVLSKTQHRSLVQVLRDHKITTKDTH